MTSNQADRAISDMREAALDIDVALGAEREARMSAEAELARVNALLKARTDALNRTVKRAETAEATVARVEALGEEWRSVGRHDRAAKRALDKLVRALYGEQP